MACSGDIYEGVPMVRPSREIVTELVAWEIARARPKSATSALPSAKRMLPGLMSRWTTSCPWA